MAGYSGTPLHRKLGLSAGMAVAFPGAPSGVVRVLAPVVDRCSRRHVARFPIDLVVLFGRDHASMSREFRRWSRALTPDGSIWLAWPKQSSGAPTDLGDRSVRTIGLSNGFVDVKVCAISPVWSGLKFVRRLPGGRRTDRSKSV